MQGSELNGNAFFLEITIFFFNKLLCSMYVLSVVTKVAFYFWLLWYVTFKKDALNVIARSFINYWNSLNVDDL